MKNYGGNLTQGYIRHKVNSDGNCGYTAFGITRKDALQLLNENLRSIQNILQLVVRETLLTQAFCDYLNTNASIGSGVTFEYIQENLEQYATDMRVLQGYLNYDVRDGHIDAGWAHPKVLQALAEICNIKLHMWTLGEGGLLLPHVYHGHDYAVYTPSSIGSRTDLLFVNRNHFERLSFYGYPNEIPTGSIYPFEPLQNFVNKNHWALFWIVYNPLEINTLQNIAYIDPTGMSCPDELLTSVKTVYREFKDEDCVALCESMQVDEYNDDTWIVEVVRTLLKSSMLPSE